MTSMSLCTILIQQIYTRWLYAPVIISFSNEATPLSDIPFPAVTVCAQNQIRSDILNYSDVVDYMLQTKNISHLKLSDSEAQSFHAASSFCEPKKIFEAYVRVHRLQLDRNIWPYVKYMVFDSFSYGSCYTTNMSVGCKDLFAKILTDVGLCHTFNQLDTKKIYYNDKLADDFPRSNKIKFRDLYGYRMENSGIGLRATVPVDQWPQYNMNSCCSDGWLCYQFTFNALQVQIHSSGSVPQLKKYSYQIPAGYSVHLTVRPNIMTTDKSLIENHSKDQRKCVAEHENDLVFFRKYSQSNCHLETYVLASIEKCGCAFFWMPRFNSTRVCDLYNDFICVVNVRLMINNLNFKAKCLPSCDDVMYDADVVMRKLENGKSTLKFSIIFKDEQYLALRRSESYTRNDFIVGCGSLLGLFMGFSFLSIIEIVYSATLRVFFDHYRQSRKKNTTQVGAASIMDASNENLV